MNTTRRRIPPLRPATSPVRGRFFGTRGFVAILVLFISVVSARADKVPVTDQTVDDAITRAVAWIKSQRNEAGHWERGEDSTARFWAGDSALALLALLYAGENPRASDMAASLAWLAAQPMKATYTRGTRAHVFALVPGRTYRGQLQEDLRWLIRAVHPPSSPHAGAYGYLSMQEARGGWYDNSNSQFGVLGVWMATEAGARAGDLKRYWTQTEKHWLADQRPDGGWTYQDQQQSTGSMTAAGLATLYVVLDHLHSGGRGKKAQPVNEAIGRGLDWLGRNFSTENPHGAQQWKYYYLYGVERVGRASGRKYLRGRDWFRIGAAELLSTQRDDGSWNHQLRDTCFALMFLCHGRAPLLFNKLDFGGDWDRYLRDVAGLDRYAQHAFERLLNWQIVSLDGTLDDLLEAPVLYLTGHDAWTPTDAQVERLREYSRRGGLIFAVVQRGGHAFAASIRALAGKMFPGYALAALPPTHPLFTGEVQFSISKPPEVLAVSNGVRTLLLLCQEDVADAWNRYRVRSTPREFWLGCNVYMYATDKHIVRSRLQTPTIVARPVRIRRTIEVARVHYAGDWDIERYGWQRLAAWMNNTAATRLLVEPDVALDSTELQDFRVAYMTGTRAFELTAGERAGLRRFLAGGGTLLADAAGGSTAFARSFERELRAILGHPAAYLEPDDPILTGEGIPGARPLRGVGYRRAVRRPGRGRRLPPLRAFRRGRRAVAVYSPLDLSTGLLGTPVFGCRGFAPASSLEVVRNMLLYAGLSSGEKARLGKRP